MSLRISPYISPFIPPLFRKKEPQPVFNLQDLRGKNTDELENLWDNHLEEVKRCLLSAPMTAQNELRPIFENLSFTKLSSFFDHFVQNDGVIPEVLYDCIPLDKICDDPEQLEEWAREVSDFVFGEIPSDAPQQNNHRRNVVTQFFPNLAHVFMRSFTLFDTDRPPATLYEYGVLTTLYFNFFQIPYVLFQSLHKVIPNPWKVLATGTLILGMAVGLLYSYLRWFKGCPNHIIHCETKASHSVFGRENEYNEVKIGLEAGRSVLVHGEPGVGKTEFWKGLATRFPEYRFFVFKNGEIFANGSWSSSAAEKIVEAFQDAEGFPQIVFCLDEFGDNFESNKSDIKAVLKPVLGDNYPAVRFIAATTSDQWNKIIKEDEAIRQRFYEIHLKPTSARETEAILFFHAYLLRMKVPISKKGLIKIVELTPKLRKDAQPRSSVNILKELASRLELFNPSTYSPKELLKAKKKLNRLVIEALFSFNPRKYVDSIKSAKRRVLEIEQSLEGPRQLAERIWKLYRLRAEVREQRNQLIKKIANHVRVTDHDRVKVVCLDTLLIPKLKSHIKLLSEQLDPRFHLRLDVRFVESYFAKMELA